MCLQLSAAGAPCTGAAWQLHIDRRGMTSSTRLCQLADTLAANWPQWAINRTAFFTRAEQHPRAGQRVRAGEPCLLMCRSTHTALFGQLDKETSTCQLVGCARNKQFQEVLPVIRTRGPLAASLVHQGAAEAGLALASSLAPVVGFDAWQRCFAPFSGAAVRKEGRCLLESGPRALFNRPVGGVRDLCLARGIWKAICLFFCHGCARRSLAEPGRPACSATAFWVCF